MPALAPLESLEADIARAKEAVAAAAKKKAAYDAETVRLYPDLDVAGIRRRLTHSQQLKADITPLRARLRGLQKRLEKRSGKR